jgi:hypothetical protein
MRPTSRKPPRRGAARSACGLALVLALAHGTTGCAHQQLTNADVVFGAVAVAAVVAGAVLMTSSCNELTTQCRPGEGRIVQLAPDAPPLHANYLH